MFSTQQRNICRQGMYQIVRKGSGRLPPGAEVSRARANQARAMSSCHQVAEIHLEGTNMSAEPDSKVECASALGEKSASYTV